VADIVLIRHGETEWSSSGQHTGRTDIGLTERGCRQADALAPRLVDVQFGLALTSPMARARETAQRAGLQAEPDPDLLEWDYGAWEGRTTADIRATLRNPAWTIWAEPIPAGATPGEQAQDVAVRSARVIERCLPVLAAGRSCALVAHGHVLRILAATWLGLPAIDGRLLALAPATLSSLGFEREQRVITSWNA
jgi:broad specificity phosphatase PhoE